MLYFYKFAGAGGLSQYYASPVQCLGFRKFGGGREVRAIFGISRGVEEFSGSRGVLRNFQDPGGG